MHQYEAKKILRASGYSYLEATHLLYKIRVQRVAPRSGVKADPYLNAGQTLRELGIEPDELVFRRDSPGSPE